MTPILKNQKLILQFRHEKPSFFSNLLLFYLLKSSYLRCIRFISSWRRLLRVPGPGPKIGQTSQLPKQKLHTFNVYSFYLKFVALKNNLIYACTRKKNLYFITNYHYSNISKRLHHKIQFANNATQSRDKPPFL